MTESLSRPVRCALSALWFLLLAALAVHVVHAVSWFGGKSADNVVGNWVYDAVLIGSAALCGARAALLPQQRFARRPTSRSG